MDEVETLLKKEIDGDIFTDIASRRRVSHDTSIYELTPSMVITPLHAKDIQRIVSCINHNQPMYPSLSITPRGAGTDMTGGALGNSIVLDTTKHLNNVAGINGDILEVEPGVYMRDIEQLLDNHSSFLGFVPASRAYCTIGGMVANNAGGDQSLRYGNANRWVRELQVVLSDGELYTIKPLTKRQLDRKMAINNFEGNLYRNLFHLIENNYDSIKNARPHVNKVSTGYNLWDVWDRDTGIFDMTQLFSGSQGTLGIITNAKIKLIKKAPFTQRVVMYIPSVRHLGEIITTVLDYAPATLEGFDDLTFHMGIRHFKTLRRQLGAKEYVRQQTRLLSSVAMLKGRIPRIFLTVEFDGDNQNTVRQTISSLQEKLRPFHVRMTLFQDLEHAEHFWTIRRAAFTLLRQQAHDRYAAPFIDDMAVSPQFLPQFIPELRRVLRKYKLAATIQGHFGDGNFHILPLLDFEHSKDQAKLEPILRELLPTIKQYGGTMAAEHNDGMLRGAWLPAQFGQEVYSLFRQTKEIFDPQYIFNPHKKTDASWDFSMSHIRHKNT